MVLWQTVNLFKLFYLKGSVTVYVATVVVAAYVIGKLETFHGLSMRDGIQPATICDDVKENYSLTCIDKTELCHLRSPQCNLRVNSER